MNDASISSRRPVVAATAPRWRIWHLFALTGFMAAEFALLRHNPLLGLFICGAIAAVAFYRTTERIRLPDVVRCLIALCAGVSTMLIAAEILSPFIARTKENRLMLRMQRSNNLKQVVLAISNYNGKHGGLPPPTTFQNGVPWRSWRTDVLPYVEESALASAYSRAEPWDGPHNQKLWATIKRSPSWNAYLTDAEGRTPILAVVDERSGWPPHVIEYFESQTTQRSYRGPPPERMILLIALPRPAAIWAEPHDLAPGSLAGVQLSDDGRPIAELLVGFANGRVEYLSIDEIKELAQQLFQPTSQGASP